MKVTQWFNRQTKPVNPGVYQVSIKSCRDSFLHLYAKWDGSEWKVVCFSPELASTQADRSVDCYFAMIAWRGLSEKPK